VSGSWLSGCRGVTVSLGRVTTAPNLDVLSSRSFEFELWRNGCARCVVGDILQIFRKAALIRGDDVVRQYCRAKATNKLVITAPLVNAADEDSATFRHRPLYDSELVLYNITPSNSRTVS
jgi:hypothetical protein